jgi:pyruvate/2-oxoglutarate dehydrogenase complex dihydrolipoamide acyltransferase (E2) component
VQANKVTDRGEYVMAKPIIMPQVGQDIKTGTIVKWCIKENNCVNKGDI